VLYLPGGICTISLRQVVGYGKPVDTVAITWVQSALIALVAYLAMSVWPLGVEYFTLYRPLVGGTIVGLILGDVQQGMAFGAALNAVYLGFISTGGTLPSDLVTAGYMGTALALASGLDVDAALATFGIPLGVLGGVLWYVRMTVGSVFVHWADARAERGDTRGVAAINLWAGQSLLFLLYALPTFVVCYYGPGGIERLLALLPERLTEALAVVGEMLPAVGIGLLLRSIGKLRLAPYLIIGFVLASYLDLPIQVIALLGAAVAWLAVGAGKGAGAAIRSQGDEGAEPRRVVQVPRRVLWGAWWRWLLFIHASYNYERLQGLGFAHAMKPVIEHLYTTAAGRAAALRRHLAFFNSEPQFGALVPGAVIALEEERAAGADLSDETINGVKSGLMGPLAGVGDSLIQGLITPLLLSVGISLAQRGTLAGPVLYVLSISPIIIGSSYAFWRLGYRWGRAAVSRVLASGWVQALTEAATVVGMTVLGALAATVVRLSTPASLVVGQAVISWQRDVLDVILLNALPLVLTLAVWRLLYLRVPSMRVIGGLFVLGIVLTYLGLTGRTAPSLFSAQWVTFVLGGTPVTVTSALMHLWPPIVAILAFVAFAFLRRKRQPPHHDS
jgi:PTS system mannose-specific IID component